MEIYKSVGTKIRQNLTGLRQAQLEMLENGFNEIDGVDPAAAKAKGSPPKEPVEEVKKQKIGSKPTSQ